MNRNFQILAAGMLILFIIIAFTEPAFAGPGGKIASVMFRSFWAKVVLAILIILFLPLILYVWLKEHFAERRTISDLRNLARDSRHFDWLLLRERISECFYRVHTAWRREDMARASEWMTDWYWRNQQIVYIDQWVREGLVNRCRVKKITAIRPLFLAYRDEGAEHDGSRIAVSISARMEDYLARRENGEIVEGKKGFTEVETVWTFIFTGGKWVVANIEESDMSLSYARLTNELPAHMGGCELKR
ncbi:hypothetical protein QUF80_21630 [Desulfococcaceae bacterium HSG8]|nr:hypothetical protein [Desulfococcaceae bacterium HSG8]